MGSLFLEGWMSTTLGGSLQYRIGMRLRKPSEAHPFSLRSRETFEHVKEACPAQTWRDHPHSTAAEPSPNNGPVLRRIRLDSKGEGSRQGWRLKGATCVKRDRMGVRDLAMRAICQCLLFQAFERLAMLSIVSTTWVLLRLAMPGIQARNCSFSLNGIDAQAHCANLRSTEIGICCSWPHFLIHRQCHPCVFLGGLGLFFRRITVSLVSYCRYAMTKRRLDGEPNCWTLLATVF